MLIFTRNNTDGGLKLVPVKSGYDKKNLIFLYRILLMDDVSSIQFKADLIRHHSLSWPFVLDCELFVAPLAILPILVQSLCVQLKDSASMEARSGSAMLIVVGERNNNIKSEEST